MAGNGTPEEEDSSREHAAPLESGDSPPAARTHLLAGAASEAKGISSFLEGSDEEDITLPPNRRAKGGTSRREERGVAMQGDEAELWGAAAGIRSQKRGVVPKMISNTTTTSRVLR